MNELVQRLRENVRGELRTDSVSRGIYSTDASIYQILPAVVLLPRDHGDVAAAVETAAASGVSILPRGAGTSLGGQATGPSLVLDFTKHMNRLIEVNAAERWARVEPGIVRDELNARLAKDGLFFAPDTATANRATLGGMIGNNSSGMRSLVYGKTVDHVIEMEVLLADGERLNLRPLRAEEYARLAAGRGREAEVYRRFQGIVEPRRAEIEKRFPKVMRRVGGYNLDEFLHSDSWNLSRLIVGSEGTLATVLEAKVRLEPLPKASALTIPHFRSLRDALEAVAEILPSRPSAVEVLDRTVITEARTNPSTAPLCDFFDGDPDAILIVEYMGERAPEAEERAREAAADLLRRGAAFAAPVQVERSAQERAWEVRRSGLGLVMAIPGNRKAIPFIEDACVPIEHLPDYIYRVAEVCRKHGTYSVLYGHASVGVLHVRPALDLRKPEEIETMKAIAEEAFALVRSYNGSWSGEHGDGFVRSAFLERFFGGEIYQAFREVKELFDPRHLLNPGKIVDAPPIDSNLRYGPSYHPTVPETYYHYRKSGGYAAAVEMCNGVGACRKTLSGTMCPSYRATRDEEHSTRGRANALRLAMAGVFGEGALSSQRLFEVLDLCFSCKACKSECPSNVDIAKLKSEFLQRYRDERGASMRDRMIAASPRLASWIAGPAAPLVNTVQKSGLFRFLLEKVANVDRRRTLPSYAREPFHRWFAGRPVIERQEKVVLFDDTYMNYHEPAVGRAAVRLLESCGYQVILARAGCCQRPRISHGFLREAKRDGERTLRNLDRYLSEGIPVLVCEPGCASALTDDLPDLIDDEGLAARAEKNILMIDVFLARELREGRISVDFLSPRERIVIHGHCHQKSLYGTAAMKEILTTIPGLVVEEVDSGCCGMAGSFGYEKEHYDLSMKAGEDRLFPYLRSLPEETAVVACGFSCRHQIRDGTGMAPVHWVETLAAKERGA